MNKLYISIFIIFFIFNKNVSSQTGGQSVYKFLTLPASPRIAAMGGNSLAINDNDISIAINNPSLITAELNNNLALNTINYYSKINYGTLSYGKSFNKAGNFIGSIQYLNYGTINAKNEFNDSIGRISSADYAMIIGWGRSLDSSFHIGANLKNIISNIAGNKSYGIAIDLSASYIGKNNFTASLLLRNMGRQITLYTLSNREKLPFEIQLALSKKLKHVPFRYSILLTNLQKWDLTYNDPLANDIDFITGEVIKKNKTSEFLDKAMRHIVIGGEFNFSKSFFINIGYNYQRRQELKIDSKASTIGISWGFGFKIAKFKFNYARSAYHLAGSPNFVSIGYNF